MALTKSRGNMYSFITHTWNAIKGICFHDCSYCYMKKFDALLPVRIDTKELNVNLGNGNFIFVGSGTDMWAFDIPSDWITQVLDYCNLFDNRYLFQSKDPERFMEFIGHPVMKKSVLCTTIETNRFYPSIVMNAPKAEERAYAMYKLAKFGMNNYVTCEPLMKFDLPEMVELIKMCSPVQVNIGRNSRKDISLPEPTKNEVQALITELRRFTKVEIKSNAQCWI